ncbi:MAG: cytochrome c [Bacteroidota bacterium]|nr:cytochrome c [Bacteroidota bacterium]
MALNNNYFRNTILLMPFLLLLFSFHSTNKKKSNSLENPWYAPKWADTLTHVKIYEPDFIKAGQKIYLAHCIVCHGEKGRGDGESGFGLSIPPGDLNDPFTLNESDGSIYWKITNGRKPMPEYITKLKDEERWQLVAFIRDIQKENLAKKENRKPKKK